MFSIRNIIRSSGVVALLFVGAGCMDMQPHVVITRASVADQPQADEATEFRAAPRSVAAIHSGATLAGPTYWYYNTDPAENPLYTSVTDSFLFLAQTASLPVTSVIDDPRRYVVYEGDVLAPSYTAAPPLAPEKPYGPPNPDPDPLSAPNPLYFPPIAPLHRDRAAWYTPATRPAAAPATRPATK